MAIHDLFPEWGFAEAFGVPRSPRWDAVRDAHVAANPRCRCCGRQENLQVHHVRPYHLFPDLELDPDNLVTLCVGGPINCHYLAGHGGAGWHRFVESVDGSIEQVRDLIATLRVMASSNHGEWK